jgi:hypothetical protein
MKRILINSEKRIGVALFGSLALFVGLLWVVLWIAAPRTEAAISKNFGIGGLERGPSSRSEVSNGGGISCENHVKESFLEGTFQLNKAGKTISMNLYIGKPLGRTVSDDEVWGFLSQKGMRTCDAFCKVVRFERFAANAHPALMQLECEGSTIQTLRMPVFVEWKKVNNSNYVSQIQLGSPFLKMEQSPLTVSLNRYWNDRINLKSSKLSAKVSGNGKQ